MYTFGQAVAPPPGTGLESGHRAAPVGVSAIGQPLAPSIWLGPIIPPAGKRDKGPRTDLCSWKGMACTGVYTFGQVGTDTSAAKYHDPEVELGGRSEWILMTMLFLSATNVLIQFLRPACKGTVA